MISPTWARFPMWALLAISVTSVAHARDSIQPTTPEEFRVISETSNSISLSWNASTDNRRVRHYNLFREGQKIGKTSRLVFTDPGLTPATSYLYEVRASDGINDSDSAFLTAITNAVQADDGTKGPSAGKGKGRGKNKPEPAPEPTPDPAPGPEPDPVPDPAPDPVPDPAPDPAPGPGPGWSLVFSDDFDGSGDLAVGAGNNWRHEDMSDPLHRAGNSGMDETGDTSVPEWQSARGKRWSAWYDDFHQENAYRDNGLLVMGGKTTSLADPTRPIPYLDQQTEVRFGDNRLYASWIDTWSRKWVGPGDEHAVDPASPGKSFLYGYFEARVNFSQMRTPGFRVSMWLMPASTDAAGQNLVTGTAYDNSGDNGVEIDLFEYEWHGEAHENKIELAMHGGGVGSHATTFDGAEFGISLHEGWHTIGLLWRDDLLQWTIDGVIAHEITNPSLIPDVYSYLIVSREMNSGVKTRGVDQFYSGDVEAVPPYIPRDPGMYARNVWKYRDRIDTDQALFDYIRIWSLP